jgi:hypothetical protein
MSTTWSRANILPNTFIRFQQGHSCGYENDKKATDLILRNVPESDDEEWLEGFHVLGELVTQNFDESTDSHQSILLF